MDTNGIQPEKSVRKSWRRLVVLVLCFAIAYGLVMALFKVSPRKVLHLTMTLPVPWLLLLAARLALMLLAETFLYNCYLRHMGVRIPFPAVFSIFMTGIFAGILPGRVGELIRYYLLQRRFGIPMAKTLPIHVLFTLNAGVAAVLTALPALYLVYPRREVVIGALLALFAVLFALRTRFFRNAVIRCSAWIPFIKNHVPKVEQFLESAHHLTKPSVFIWALPLSLVYIIAMAAVCPILIAGFGLPQNILLSMAAYCVAAIAGALTLLPGGVGAFELGAAGLLTQLDIGAGHAAAVAILSSALTMWPALAVGFVCFLLNKHYLLAGGGRGKKEALTD